MANSHGRRIERRKSEIAEKKRKDITAAKLQEIIAMQNLAEEKELELDMGYIFDTIAGFVALIFCVFLYIVLKLKGDLIIVLSLFGACILLLGILMTRSSVTRKKMKKEINSLDKEIEEKIGHSERLKSQFNWQPS
jgi:hypothetical protein